MSRVRFPVRDANGVTTTTKRSTANRHNARTILVENAEENATRGSRPQTHLLRGRGHVRLWCVLVTRKLGTTNDRKQERNTTTTVESNNSKTIHKTQVDARNVARVGEDKARIGKQLGKSGAAATTAMI